jgi:hypothetical protein
MAAIVWFPPAGMEAKPAPLRRQRAVEEQRASLRAEV